MKLVHPELIEHLASHYALGTLSPRARRRFESLLSQRPDLRAAVQRWNARLNLVGAAAADVGPRTRHGGHAHGCGCRLCLRRDRLPHAL
jgi:anti-sigma-K factor RskA